MKRTNRISRYFHVPIKKLERSSMEDTNDSLLLNTINTFSDCDDLTRYSLKNKQLQFLYFKSLIDKKTYEQEVLYPFEALKDDNKTVSAYLENEQFENVRTSEDITERILNGYIAIFLNQSEAYVINAFGPKTRSIEESETETTIVGSHESFIESLAMNLSLVRRRVRSPKLKVVYVSVGEISRNTVALLYIEGLVDMELLDQVKQKINDVEVDIAVDTPVFVQMIDDFPYSFMPQYITTERPDVVVSNLANGKIAGIMDNSPTAFLAPTNFFDFFHSPDDRNQRWAVGSATRVLRMLAFFITLTFTAFYVAVTTFHYEMIPEALLMSLAESRNNVPFSPLFEALIMEVTIELLREAGARLPTKIGQTIGIVGGIVIGQSAVQAGLVSNTLIIVVAISAIASFVMPSYMISAALRIARFGLILLSGLLGNYGLLIGIILLLAHLSTLSNLSTPYFNPASPFHPKELINAVLRVPYGKNSRRPTQTRTQNKEDVKSLGTGEYE
ncbi:tetrahydromethanopterin S-methyltransferase subunit G [Salibacterium salarium]|uniref:spore germination protein n=1 Tax=Salibacterium salarium TaxID=284579 RepID=UPI00277E37FE|nr:spore germination protein [Salibacterium salarium]MDQ0300233.1 tetrahydromethanopterin S-methyltransferase subunit G [Salibacterium salarium]